MSHTGTVKQAFLNKCEQSILKPPHALVVKSSEVFVPVCHVAQLWKRDTRNIEDSYIWQSTSVKLFSAQRRETGKPLKFLDLMKATFSCGRNTRQHSVSVRCHERNSLDPRKDDFLKTMHSSHFFKRDVRLK
jgi:hypothetical protein